MSNSLFSITIAAKEVLDQVPRGLRSKFVSDAILHYAKKKNILDEYLTAYPDNTKKQKVIKLEKPLDKAETNENNVSNTREQKPKKVNVASGY
jgi:hypothetical protein